MKKWLLLLCVWFVFYFLFLAAWEMLAQNFECDCTKQEHALKTCVQAAERTEAQFQELAKITAWLARPDRIWQPEPKPEPKDKKGGK